MHHTPHQSGLGQLKRAYLLVPLLPLFPPPSLGLLFVLFPVTTADLRIVLTTADLNKLSVMGHPRVALTPDVRQLQALAQKIRTSEDAQEEAEVQLRVAALVSGPLPWQNTSAGRGRQTARGGPLSRRARDT